MLWGKDDHLWITERAGRISKIDPRTGTTVFTTTVADVVERGEGGLLGMVQHPVFQSNGFLSVVYHYEKAGVYTEKVVRLRFSNSTLTDPQGLVVANGRICASEHGPSIEDEVNIIERGRKYGWLA